MSTAPSRLRPSSSLHITVGKEILKRISNETYQPDAPIPSTAMLGEEFGVSLITIKRALRDLQAAGVTHLCCGEGHNVKKQAGILRTLDLRLPPLRDDNEIAFREDFRPGYAYLPPAEGSDAVRPQDDIYRRYAVLV
ncbi:GntR family transcriptional regulator [Bradyrhizobium sp. GCM10028915]|uniref:GntR family transcriptional regulator n=1 Tax=Bradyrhizobium sp. GCM10028915 TaxID=3273385 RepID=UPI00360D7A2A